MKRSIYMIPALLSFIFVLPIAWQKISAEPCPCDIYEAGGTPCVAAHSMVRALYGSYNGPLYQVRRTSDNQTKDIGVLTPGGYANAAVQDSFLAGSKPGTISMLYDQSPNGNHLVRSPIGGWLYSPANESNATDTSIKINGHTVYGLYTKRGGGYRNNQTKGIATGNKPEGMYMVASGKSVNDSCCYDYGNAETNMKNNGTGTMETIYLGKMCWFTPCTGTGPWVFADLENGLFAGNANGRNTNNTSVPYDYVTAMVKGNATTYDIRAGNAQSGSLKTMADSTPRPTVNKLEGAIILGVGGDNSWAARGIFFEGAITTGRPPDTTEDAVQNNIIAAGYGRNFVSLMYGNSRRQVMQASSFATSYNQSSSGVIISYTVRDAHHVRIHIFNQQGRRIGTVVDSRIAAGPHKAVWRAGRFPTGVYFWRISVDGREGGAGKIIVGK
jgi:non-reducing end alpha-L-arabinofuranosidase